MDRGNPRVSSGFVIFPTGDPKFDHTGEGGLYVQLVAIPSRDYDFMVCDGGGVQVLAQGNLVGDDVTSLPPLPEKPKPGRKGMGWFRWRTNSTLGQPDTDQRLRDYQEQLDRRRTMLAQIYYPGRVKIYDVPPTKKSLSIDYYAIVTLGSSGWVGYNREADRYWTCSFDDLTDDGRKLYSTLQTLFGDTAYLALQTWLDH